MFALPRASLVLLAFSASLPLPLLACSDSGPSDDELGDTSSESESSTSGQSETDTSSETASDTSSESDSGSETGDPDACWTDLGFGEVEVFYQGFTEGSEGIAFGADGLLYVTTTVDGDGTIWQLDADANLIEFAKVPSALGIAPRSDGGFVVASIGVNDPAVNDGAVYLVDARGVATQLASGIASPNFVTIAPEGSVLVSDDFDDTRVFRVDAQGQVGELLTNVPSPNGMAFSPDGAHFYVASTFTPQGQLTRYELDGEGLPIEATAIEILQLGQASTPDGIAIDAEGMVYVAANIPGQIWRVDGAAAALQAGELVAEGLGSPASLAFGRGEGFDPCSIYVTQLFGSQILRVGVGVAGAPLYGELGG